MPTALITSADDQYLHELLNADSQVVFVVPPYQREYSWAKQQWDELYTDIVDEPAEDGHFLGTIICVNQSKNSTKEVVLELIDGQQRMTTLSLLLVILYSELRSRRDQFLEDEERYGIYLNLKKQLVLNGKERLRPQIQGANLADYRWILKEAGLIEKASPPQWHGNRRMARAMKYLRSELSSELEPLSADEALSRLFEITRRVRHSVMVKLEVSNHASAFVLFESLNNRGMELSPIDLIKNTLLMRAEHQSEERMESAYEEWKGILGNLGESYTDQERFLRYYYNAFEPVGRGESAVPVATRSNLIRLYEEYIGRGIDQFLRDLTEGSKAYGTLIGVEVESAPIGGSLQPELRSLSRAQGSPGYSLLMYLLVHRLELGLSNEHLIEIVGGLTSFFVRRHLTGWPQTYALPRIFREIVHAVRDIHGDAIVSEVRARLVRESRSDAAFDDALRGDIYADNSDMARFVLTSLAEDAQTTETMIDLWARTSDGKHYVWTIEHIFPQGDNIPDSWVAMMGGADAAKEAHQTQVHKLGNLTLTGYNSTLGNKSFQEKRDRTNASGAYVGYRNGLSLNSGLAARESWAAHDIRLRTEDLVQHAISRFRL